MATKKAAKKRPVGRPPKRPQDRRRRENRLTIMLWPEERAKIDAAAGGRDVSTWLRELALAQAAR